MQNLVRSKTIGVTENGGRGTAGAGPGRDLLYRLSLLGMAEKLGCSGGGQITANAHGRHLTVNPLPLGITFCRPLQGTPFSSIDIGATPCAVAALCLRCPKSRLFSTTGSHRSQGPEFLILQPLLVHQGFFRLV